MRIIETHMLALQTQVAQPPRARMAIPGGRRLAQGTSIKITQKENVQ
jgi:hypothetical protein